MSTSWDNVNLYKTIQEQQHLQGLLHAVPGSSSRSKKAVEENDPNS